MKSIKDSTTNPTCIKFKENPLVPTDPATLMQLLLAFVAISFIVPRGVLRFLIFFFLLPIGIIGAGVLVFFDTQYDGLTSDNSISIDAYTCKPANLRDRAQISIVQSLVIGSRTKSEDPIELGMTDSPYVPGLSVSGNFNKMDSEAKPLTLGKDPLVVGTIRMGFGHHRIAYAVSSWGMKAGAHTVFHDFLAVKSEEASLIHYLDQVYSQASRFASELGGPFELAWGMVMRSGDENALRITNQMAEQIRPLLWGFPKDTPIIATHSMVGHTAVAAGFKHVINLVIDNYPQWFLIVPGAINLVQGPANYMTFLRMGVPAEQLRLVGHWCPSQLVDHIDHDAQVRKQRRADNKPLRLLIPVGGAGAQKKFVTGFLTELESELKAGSVQVLLNSGDHVHMREAFEETLEKIGIKKSAYTTVKDIEGVHAFVERLMSGKEPEHSVTLFAFSDYFPAVATTDILIRVADVLCSKPSELAFYPVPKLNIRRVGDHEGFSAIRSSELGDGSPEVREVPDAAEWVRLMAGTSSLLTQINDNIMAQNREGVYNGAKEAVRLAMDLGGSA